MADPGLGARNCNRLYACSVLQVGRFREQLQPDFPEYDFSLIGDGIWWHAGGSADPKHVEIQEMGVRHPAP